MNPKTVNAPHLIALRDAVMLPRAAVAHAAAYPSRASRDADAAARAVPVAPTEAAPPVAPVPSVRLPAPRRSAAVRSVPQEFNIDAAALAVEPQIPGSPIGPTGIATSVPAAAHIAVGPSPEVLQAVNCAPRGFPRYKKVNLVDTIGCQVD